MNHAQLKELFGSGMYYFLIKVPKGDNPIEYVSAHATNNVYVTIIDQEVYAASTDSEALNNIINKLEIQ